MSDCTHNQRCRYTDGFYCEDCRTFFGKDSPTYRSGELLSALWAVLHNVGTPDAHEMRDKIGIGVRHKDYEGIIAEAEEVMERHGVNATSADVVLGEVE